MFQTEIFVCNLPFACSDADLKNLFHPFGVVRAKVMRSVDTGVTLMFGFVTLVSKEAAVAAVQLMHNHYFYGRYIRVEPKEDKPSRRSNFFYSVHFYFSVPSVFSAFGQVRPMSGFSEVAVREALAFTGIPILDVQINKFELHRCQYFFSGFGFITLVDDAAKQLILQLLRGREITAGHASIIIRPSFANFNSVFGLPPLLIHSIE